MDRFGLLTRTRRRAAIAVIVFVALGLPLHVAMKRHANPSLLTIGEQAPALQGPTLSEKSYDSHHDRGRVIVLAFVDPADSSAAAQGMNLSAWRQMFVGPRVALVTVLTGGTPEQQTQYAATFGLDPDMVVIDRGNTRQEPFRVARTPTVYVIDPVNIVRFAEEGVVSAAKPSLVRVIESYRVPEHRRMKERRR